MRKTYINPRTTLIACRTEFLTPGSPVEVNMGGRADGDFVELSREEQDNGSAWDGFE